MKLEQQVVSLELAKRLKELGCKQESAFYWSYEVDVEDKYFLGPKHNGFNLLCSSFTVAELGEMLKGFQIPHWSGQDRWATDCEPYCKSETEANARAKMLIHLIEKGIVKP